MADPLVGFPVGLRLHVNDLAPIGRELRIREAGNAQQIDERHRSGLRTGGCHDRAQSDDYENRRFNGAIRHETLQIANSELPSSALLRLTSDFSLQTSLRTSY